MMTPIWIACCLMITAVISCQEDGISAQPNQSSTWELLCGRKWRLAEETSGNDTAPYGQTTTYYSDDADPRLVWEFGCDGHFTTSHLYDTKGEWMLSEGATIICKKVSESNGQPLYDTEMKCEYYVLELTDTLLSVKFHARPGWVYHVFRPYDEMPVPSKK